jgi:3-dehydroquinate dehydratase
MRKKVAVLGLGMFGYKFAVDAAKKRKNRNIRRR